MCCKLLAVTELNKPKFKLCDHCDVGVGCRIYQDRPANCAAFRCLWLQTQNHVPSLPLQLRPDKSKVVLHVSADEKSVIAKVDPGYPNAWKEKGIGLLLGQLAEKCFVLVDNNKEYFMLRNGIAKSARISASDENGNETFIEYAGGKN